MFKHKLITIVGPTASGKTSLAVELAQRHNGEIICADSRTVYRGMDIGTAKPTAAERAAVPHHGLDLIEPGQSFTAANFKNYAEQTMASVWRREKVPFLVGGSGLYVDAVLFDYQFRGQNSSEDFSELDDKALLELAAKRYPKQLAAMDRHNRRRIEQLLTRGPADTADRQMLKYHACIIGLSIEIPLLKQKIEQRLQAQLDNGFVQEVERLRQRYGRGCPQLQTIGYREINLVLDDEVELAIAKQQIIKAELTLAHRQMTWFRRNPAIHWVENPTEADQLISAYLQVKTEPGVK